MFLPEIDAEGAAKTAPRAAGPSAARKSDPKPAGAVKRGDGGDFSRARSNFDPAGNDPRGTVTKDDIGGLCFDRAHPGDKRLG